jgi:dihydropteroate synthase-like protein
MPCCLFVTGQLASQSLNKTLEGISPKLEYEIAVLPISVASLMDARFVAKHLTVAAGYDRVMLPGLCRGNLNLIADKLGLEIVRGPKDLKDIPDYFGTKRNLEGYGAHRVKILAEIVDAYTMSLEEIIARASYFKACGADVIDLGCPVEGGFRDIEGVVRALKANGFLVSVDSFNADDILNADRAGVDFLLSVNSKNISLARRLRCRAVVIPDDGQGMESMERTIAQLEAWRIPHIIDPILKPIGFGFTRSIQDFIATRRKHPDAEMLMGLGNLTELTDADTTGITAVMVGIVAELGIDYVLTAEVSGHARGAVRELDLARRLMHYACRNKILPKHLNDGLMTIKDPTFGVYSEGELCAMQAQVRDRNFRIFTGQDALYVFNNQLFIKDTDIQNIFSRLGVEDAAQAFYLGKEMQKAALAMQLGKKYVQEEDLRWGYLSSQTKMEK